MTHQQLNLASDLVRHSHEEARRSIATLRPETHGSADLLPALAVCAQRMVEGGTVEIVASSSGESTSIPLRITDTLYRIGQEAIANSIRHAHPTTLNIMLEFTSGSVRLTITDNGEGFVPGGDLRGFGVRGMRKRAASISAAFKIESRPGQGTVVETTAPLPAKITARMLPKFFWLQLRKQTSHVPNAGKANLYSDRR